MDFVIFEIGGELDSRLIHNRLPCGARIIAIKYSDNWTILVSAVEADTLDLTNFSMTRDSKYRE